MNVELTGVAEDVVARLINSGDAATPEEALRLMAERCLADLVLLDGWDNRELEEEIRKGFDSGFGSEVTPEYWKKMRAKLDHHLAKKQDSNRKI